MLRRIGLTTLFGLFLFSFLAGCAGLMGAERRESNAEVRIISFGATNGEIAPCG